MRSTKSILLSECSLASPTHGVSIITGDKSKKISRKTVTIRGNLKRELEKASGGGNTHNTNKNW
jgi:hypothetical protein